MTGKRRHGASGPTHEQIYAADEWSRTDPSAIRNDIGRLGLKGAAKYNRELVLQGIERGDKRFKLATVAALEHVFRQFTRGGGKRRHASGAALIAAAKALKEVWKG